MKIRKMKIRKMKIRKMKIRDTEVGGNRGERKNKKGRGKSYE